MSSITTLLVVDDATIIRHLIRRTLRHVRPSATVVDAAGVGTALQALREGAITAILTDIHLPDGSGLHVLAAAQAQLPALPVVCMSSDTSAKPDVLAAGAAAFLPKPFALEQLLMVLQELP